MKGKARLVSDFLSRIEGDDSQVEGADEGNLITLKESMGDEYEEKIVQVERILTTQRREEK